jgi:TetR/AcrR family transcriptional regulator, transcriptional repressor for nem operon
VLSLMVGAVTLSRIMTDEAISDRVLEAASNEVKRLTSTE